MYLPNISVINHYENIVLKPLLTLSRFREDQGKISIKLLTRCNYLQKIKIISIIIINSIQSHYII